MSSILILNIFLATQLILKAYYCFEASKNSNAEEKDKDLGLAVDKLMKEKEVIIDTIR